MPADLQIGLGALDDPVDERDFLLTNLTTLPTPPDAWATYRTTVRYQQSLGCCVGEGGSGQLERLHRAPDLSEQWLYGQCKLIDGMPGVEGTFPRAMYQIAVQKGCPEEKYQPFEGVYPPRTPDEPGAEENAKKYRIGTYAAVPLDWESLLAARYAVGPEGSIGVAIKVFESMAYGTGSDGIVPMPSGRFLGGHFMSFDGGWTPTRGAEVKNSWSQRHGDQGYDWIREAVWNEIAVGAWTIVDEIALITRHWIDWPESRNLVEQDVVWKSGIMVGNNGFFNPWAPLLERHVAIIAKRMGLVDIGWRSEWAPATRGWVRDSIPGLTWEEERWDEQITRFQMCLLIARKLQGR